MELTITIPDTEALVDALLLVEAALADPQRATEALTLARDVLEGLTVAVTGAEDERALEERWMGAR